eukprot:Gb_15742 [translate_table: standard]
MDHLELATYLMIQLVFYKPGPLAFVGGMVAMKPTLLEIIDEAIHKEKLEPQHVKKDKKRKKMECDQQKKELFEAKLALVQAVNAAIDARKEAKLFKQLQKIIAESTQMEKELELGNALCGNINMIISSMFVCGKDRRLNNNGLVGKIPVSLTNVSTLQVLDLSTNKLSGAVPTNGSFSLFTPISFQNNSLCGPAVGRPCPGSPPFSPPPPFVPPPPASGNQSSGKSSITGAIAGGVAAGAALLFAIPAFSFVWLRRRRPHEPYFDVPAEEDPEVHLGQLKRFSLRELLVATDGFNQRNVLGRGGFGKVYKGRLADGSLVAVKRLKEERTPGGELQFQTEVEMISMAVHRNLLRLRGFCMTPTERLLVYPYMANGSVASCLRGMEIFNMMPTLFFWPKSVNPICI